jgi:hypothetical protein
MGLFASNCREDKYTLLYPYGVTINHLCSWAKCAPDPDQLYGRCESEMSPVDVSESGSDTSTGDISESHLPYS